MRLTPHDREAIVRAAGELAGRSARVLLFGSRVHDELRGGDIDLLIELPEPNAERLALADRIAVRIQRAIGLRKIDVLVADPHTPDSPVLRAARREGVPL